jgi:transcriptional regulator with XRE-family HTH domain
MAECLGIDRSTVARCEQGLSTPRPWYRPLWAKALEVTLDELDALLAPGNQQDLARRDFLHAAALTAAGMVAGIARRSPDHRETATWLRSPSQSNVPHAWNGRPNSPLSTCSCLGC